MSEYAVGIVGCGTMGRFHARAYEAHEGTEIAAVADLDETIRSEHAEEFDVPATYETHADMLEAEDLDLVSVCTLHSTHAAITIDAAESGIDGLWCEKPMAVSHGQAMDMLDAAENNDVKLTVAHQYRFNRVHEKARELIQDGAIGEPRLVTTRARDGLLNWGTHLVDMTRYLLDDPDYEWVMGQAERRTDRYERALPIEDRALGQICYADGTRQTHETDLPEPNEEGIWIHVSGSEGVLELDFNSSVTVVNEDGRTEYAPEDDRDARVAYLDAMVEWLEGDRSEHRCSGDRAATVTEILMSIYESARTGGVVESPLRTRANPLEAMIASGELDVEYPGAYDIRLPYTNTRNED